jgi:hypothetical protein
MTVVLMPLQRLKLLILYYLGTITKIEREKFARGERCDWNHYKNGQLGKPIVIQLQLCWLLSIRGTFKNSF